eukprot:13966288-Alexandrium_andersonii.AAC.1
MSADHFKHLQVKYAIEHLRATMDASKLYSIEVASGHSHPFVPLDCILQPATSALEGEDFDVEFEGGEGNADPCANSLDYVNSRFMFSVLCVHPRQTLCTAHPCQRRPQMCLA